MSTVALTPTDTPRLAEQVALAGPGTRFELAPGHYEVPSLVTRAEVTVAGTAAAETVVEMRGSCTVERGSLTLEGLTLQGGHGVWGGAVEVVNGSGLALDRCIVSGNRAARIGGGIHLGRGNATLSRCLFIGNEAPAGAALSVHERSSAVVDRCLFLDNVARVGGALMVNASARVTVKSCTFLRNQATLAHEKNQTEEGGAAVALLGTSRYGPEVQLVNCLFGDARPLANHPVKVGLLRLASCLLLPGSLEQLMHSDGGDNLEVEPVWTEYNELPLLAPGSPGRRMADITQIEDGVLDFLGRSLVVGGEADPGALGGEP